jgi:hypothetical protein
MSIQYTRKGKMEYQNLTDEQKATVIEQRITQYEVEHFNTSMELMSAETATNITEEERAQRIEAHKAQLENCEALIEAHKDKLAEITGEDKSATKKSK